MSSSWKYAALTVLRSISFSSTQKFVTRTTPSVSLQLPIFSKLKTLTNNTTTFIRNYYQYPSNYWKEEQESKKFKAFKLIYSLNSIKGDNTRSLRYFHRYKKIMDTPPGIFQGSTDRFNGVTVESSKEFIPEDKFMEKLKRSLAYWKEKKRRAIWFKVNSEHSEWVPHLTKMNFDFHHAKNGVVVLARWLPENEVSNLPVYAHTMVGVGGLVINDNNEVLVVSDHRSLIPSSWKLPGGYVEPKENIVDAAIREVLEETGVVTVFDTIITLRHSHKGNFGCSDMYCVVALKPKTLELKPCDREISAIKWMPAEEYLNHPNVHETNRHFVKCFFDYKQRGIRFTYEKTLHEILKVDYHLYYIKPLEEEDTTNKSESCINLHYF